MRCFVLGFCALVLLAFGLSFFSESAQARVPVPPAFAQHWWRTSDHGGPGPMGAGADKISKWTWPNIKSTWPHIRKTQLESPTPLYTTPKPVGWWHKSPAPMGAGSDRISKLTWPSIKSTWPHIRKPQLEKPTPLYTTPKSVGWWLKSPGPAGAGSGN